MATPYTEPMEIGEIFGNTFAITRRTLAGVGLVTLLMLIVAGIISGYGNMLYVTKSLETMTPYVGTDLKTDSEAAAAVGQAMVTAMVPFLGTMFLFFLLTITAQTMMTAAGWEALTGERTGLVRRAIGRPLIINFLQTIILGAVMVMIYLIFAIIAWPMGDAGGVILRIVPLVPFLAVVVYTMVRVQNVVVEDRGPWRGIIASITQVKGSFWRILFLVFMLGLGYAAGALLINQLTTGDALGSFGMGSGGSQSGDVEESVAALTAASQFLTWPYIIGSSIWNAITFILFFNMATVVYADLRARHGEFLAEGEEGEWELPT